MSSFGGPRAIPRDVYEAARLDGISRFRRFTRITWPLMAPSVTVNVLFAVIGSLTTHNLIYVLTTGLYGTDILGMFSLNSAFGSSANIGPFLYSMLGVWNDIIGPIVLLATPSFFPVTRGVYNFYGTNQSEAPLLAAAVVIVSLPIVALFVASQRQLLRSATGSGVRERSN